MIHIIENHYMTETEQYRFPRYHKKSYRITKKFAKRYSRQVPSKKVIETPYGYVCHPTVAAILRKGCDAKDLEHSTKVSGIDIWSHLNKNHQI